MKKKHIKTPYDRRQNIRLELPFQFMLLCELLQIPPMKIIDQFMVDVSSDPFNRSIDDEQREKAVEYFIRGKYGQDKYTEEQVRQMFKELHAVGLLWPPLINDELLTVHANWRKIYLKYWVIKWVKKRQKQ